MSEQESQGFIRAKFQTEGKPMRPLTTMLQFGAEGANLSGADFELAGPGALGPLVGFERSVHGSRVSGHAPRCGRARRFGSGVTGGSETRGVFILTHLLEGKPVKLGDARFVALP